MADHKDLYTLGGLMLLPRFRALPNFPLVFRLFMPDWLRWTRCCSTWNQWARLTDTSSSSNKDTGGAAGQVLAHLPLHCFLRLLVQACHLIDFRSGKAAFILMPRQMGVRLLAQPVPLDI